MTSDSSAVSQDVLFGRPFTLGDSVVNTDPCIVSASTRIVGDVQAEAEIHIFGVVEGDVISSASVLVLENAQVRGRISSPNVVVAGLVVGEISASRELAVRACGVVRGTVVSGSLYLELGGTIVGRCLVPDEGT